MWQLVLILLIPVGHQVAGELVGAHVCQEQVRSTINVTEYSTRNATVRNYQWCLNVPPRCSFYTAKIINESRIVEKEVVEVVQKCCEGFQEDESGHQCRPICPNCQHGVCLDGRCSCQPGFQGELCDTECDLDEWGPNCLKRCLCVRGRCDPVSGSCSCPSGWNGSECQHKCPQGSYGNHCQEVCSCNPEELCHHVTGNCTPTSPPAPILIPLKNNGRFNTDNSGLLSTSTITEEPSTTLPLPDSDETITEVITTPSIGMTTTNSHLLEEYYLNDESNYHQEAPPLDKNDLVNGASAATAITIAIIVVAVAIVTANHFRKRKLKKEADGDGKEGVPTVSVYTHSIFHTPLPDPPPFENPIFANPLESGDIERQQRFEARVVCSLNFPSHSLKDPKEYLYDHPPSTGSYRAASIPEPPDMSSTQSLEPLYDEIPLGTAPTPISEPPPSYQSPSSLYMNTCGKTRL